MLFFYKTLFYTFQNKIIAFWKRNNLLVVKKNYQSWQITKINDNKMISGASLLNLKGLAQVAVW